MTKRVVMMLVCLVAVAAIVSGCSGTATPSAGGGVLPVKIQEYVGDGGGSAKPSPFADPSDLASAMSTFLGIGAPNRVSKVRSTKINWYNLPPSTTNVPILVMLQQVDIEDSDLFLMKGNAFEYPGGGNDCLGSSIRFPSGGADAVHGNVPDWAVIRPGNTDPVPAAQVAVFAPTGTPIRRDFWVEADVPLSLAVDGAARAVNLVGGQSNWYKFTAISGQPYMVQLDNVTVGDPDVYVYGATSSDFRVGHTAAGGGSAAFVAPETSVHYVRVFGFNSGPNQCTINVVNQAP